MADKALTTAVLDTMDDDQLRKELENAKTELFNLRFALATGAGDDRGRIKALRKGIARIYTVAQERKQGIRTAPEPEE